MLEEHVNDGERERVQESHDTREDKEAGRRDDIVAVGRNDWQRIQGSGTCLSAHWSKLGRGNAFGDTKNFEKTKLCDQKNARTCFLLVRIC